MKGLVQRINTALIFVVVMLVGLYGGPFSFLLLFAIIAALCIWEFLYMVLTKIKIRDKLRLVLGTAFGITPFVLAAILKLGIVEYTDEFVIATSLLFFPFIFLAFIYELYAASDTPFINVGFQILGMVYIGAPFALLGFIAFDGQTFYANTVLGLLLLSWANDTFAYLVGSQIGKHKLFPRISPGKTWEGTIGGGICTLLVGLILSYFFTEQSTFSWIVLSLIVIVFGTIGDLVESMLKRSVGAKDSGTLLPGHGGILDRFDGFIFALPFAAAFLLWIR